MTDDTKKPPRKTGARSSDSRDGRPPRKTGGRPGDAKGGAGKPGGFKPGFSKSASAKSGFGKPGGYKKPFDAERGDRPARKPREFDASAPAGGGQKRTYVKREASNDAGARTRPARRQALIQGSADFREARRFWWTPQAGRAGRWPAQALHAARRCTACGRCAPAARAPRMAAAWRGRGAPFHRCSRPAQALIRRARPRTARAASTSRKAASPIRSVSSSPPRRGRDRQMSSGQRQCGRSRRCERRRFRDHGSSDA